MFFVVLEICIVVGWIYPTVFVVQISHIGNIKIRNCSVLVSPLSTVSARCFILWDHSFLWGCGVFRKKPLTLSSCCHVFLCITCWVCPPPLTRCYSHLSKQQLSLAYKTFQPSFCPAPKSIICPEVAEPIPVLPHDLRTNHYFFFFQVKFLFHKKWNGWSCECRRCCRSPADTTPKHPQTKGWILFLSFFLLLLLGSSKGPLEERFGWFFFFCLSTKRDLACDVSERWCVRGDGSLWISGEQAGEAAAGGRETGWDSTAGQTHPA